jgi:DNA-binding CsgD family transcriptional regulator
MMKKQLAYDDEELVELIAEGQLTYRAIGERVGISEGLVKKIAQGRRRKDLARRLWDTEDGILTEARRIGSRYARSLIMEQVRLGLTGEGEPARRAREFVLKFTMSARPRKGELPEEQQRRSEQVLQDCRDIGIVPWEDELDAEMARDAAAMTAVPVTPAASSMASVAVLPTGAGNPALASAR